MSKKEAVYETSKKMILPILYAVLTTICAFLSLIFSGIKPIIDFGMMMTLDGWYLFSHHLFRYRF